MASSEAGDWVGAARHGAELLASANPGSRLVGVAVFTELAESFAGVRRQRAVAALCAYLRTRRPFDEDVEHRPG